MHPNWHNTPGPKLDPEYEKAWEGFKPKRVERKATGCAEFDDFRAKMEEFVRKNHLARMEAEEKLTEKQVAEVILQALASGDLMKHVVVGTPHRQAVTYIPYREHERLQSRIRHLEQLLAEHGIMEEAHAIT